MDQEFLSFSESGFYLPQEEVLEKKHKEHQLSIGIPKEPSGEKKCGGYVIWNNERVALTIWGNDNTSESKDGFHAKDSFLPVFHIKNGIINNAMNSEFMAGNNFFSHNGISIIKKLY